MVRPRSSRLYDLLASGAPWKTSQRSAEGTEVVHEDGWRLYRSTIGVTTSKERAMPSCTAHAMKRTMIAKILWACGYVLISGRTKNGAENNIVPLHRLMKTPFTLLIRTEGRAR